MTQTEALRLALEALDSVLANHKGAPVLPWIEARDAVKAALEAKDEPVKLRRGDILRCIETDEFCTVWATSTTGKTLVKWGGNDFTDYTAEQIGELFWLEAKDEPVAHSVIAGALFDFMGWLTSRKERLVLSSSDEASPAVEAISNFAKMRGLSLSDAKVQDWNTPPQRTWVGLTDMDIALIDWESLVTRKDCVRAIEDKLKEKNT
jgi:hypothetical protein